MIEPVEHNDLIYGAINRGMRGYVHTDRADIVQEVYAWWLGSGASSVSAYIGPDSQYDESHGRNKLAIAIERFARNMCEREKAAAVGYNPEDTYRYTPNEVKRLLPLALDSTALTIPGQSFDSAPVHGDPAEGGNLLASVVDVRRALNGLDSLDRLFLQAFVESDTGHVAELFGLEEPSVLQRHSRLVARLVRMLGGQQPVYRRKSVSNAAAIAGARAIYEGA